MHSSAARILSTIAGTAGLAYLGYWAAMLVERVFVRAPVYLALGAADFQWRLDPFNLSLSAPGMFFLPGGFSLRALLLALPLVSLVALAAGAARWNRAGGWRGTMLDFAALWAALLVAIQVTQLAWTGRGLLAALVRSLTNLDLTAPGLRAAVVIVFAAVLLPAAAVLVRRLVAALAASLPANHPPRVRRAAAAFALVGSVSVILFGSVGFSLAGSTARLAPALWIPAGLVLGLALVAVARGERAPAPVAASLGALPALGAFAAALVLFAGMARADDVRLWWDERTLATHTSRYYTVQFDPAHYDPAAVARFAAARDERLAALAEKIGVAPPALRIVLYPDLHTLRLATRIDRRWAVSGRTIRAALDAAGALDPAADAAALLHATHGAPGDAMLGAWVARWVAGVWHGEPLERVAARILSEEGHYPLAELLDPALDASFSPLVREPLGAFWVGTIRETLAERRLLNIYRARDRASRMRGIEEQLWASPEQLERFWADATRELLARSQYTAAPRRSLQEAFLRGVSFSHEGFGGRRGGYDAPEATEQLRRLRRMGANAIAVVPYGWQRGADSTAISFTGTDETDAELAEIRRTAHALGMRVLLKPQVWIGGGSFTGNVRFTDAAARAEWFASYRRFILHYARLAEMEGFDLFSIGNELGGVTVHEAEWRALIAEVRRIWRGPLTYSSNWGEEFESLRFWDALDFLGVNNYYPLATAPTTDTEALSEAARGVARRVERVARRWQKPVLLTEVGYPSSPGAAVHPWRELRGAPPAPDEQAAAYQATLAAFTDQPWMAGMFWWKWPSNGRQSRTGHSPLGHPAEHVLAPWYTRLEEAEARARAGAERGP